MIIVTGCYAQTEPAAIRKIDGVHHIVPHREKDHIPSLAVSLLEAETIKKSAVTPCTSGDTTIPSTIPWVAGANKTRPFLKIQDGCDAFCSYCIVPHARGRSRSMAVKDVLKQLNAYRQNGFHEVVLTGIHLGRYGRDLRPPATLCDLLKLIQSRQSIDRLRLSSIEPLELTRDIIQLVDASQGSAGAICRHFHIPLQSGDNAILKKMNRPYTRSVFKKRVWDIREILPDAGIGCDILIGFPGETDDAFESTRQLVMDLPLTYLHVFPFSAREGTPASQFPGRIPDPIIKARCRVIRELGQRKRQAFLNSQTGHRAIVLVENRRDRQTGHLKGLTSNYITVLMEGDDLLMNTFQEVRLNGLHDDQTMTGTLLTGP
jgi:threonylcarbamoyladenosine tRNA methylthiotransferase MtaB